MIQAATAVIRLDDGYQAQLLRPGVVRGVELLQLSPYHVACNLILPQTIVVTSCTARKRGASSSLTLDASMIGTTLHVTAECWRAAISRQRARTPVHSLYAGRSFVEAKRAASLVGGTLHVVSAGLGVVRSDDEVPSYDLTPFGSESGLSAVLTAHVANPGDWWGALCGGQDLTRLIADNADALVLLALPSTYVRMVAGDLSRLRHEDLCRLRIFTSPAGKSLLPAAVRTSVLPYDDRLECLPHFAGTRADFSQRAMRHFVQCLAGHRVSLSKGRHAVDQALVTCVPRQNPPRARMKDEQIQRLIRKQWQACGGQGARLLRFLRDEAYVACEQGRFARLWREVRDGLKANEHALLP